MKLYRNGKEYLGLRTKTTRISVIHKGKWVMDIWVNLSGKENINLCDGYNDDIEYVVQGVGAIGD